MLIQIIIAVIAIIAVLCIIASMRPSDFSFTRSATINALPAELFIQANDLHNWNEWSPWARLDPENTKVTYMGPDSGLGAGLKWSGGKKVGEGIMTIIESRPNEFIKFKLEFLKPFKATNTAEFTYKPEGSKTLMTWSMHGKNNFIGKLMHLLINCEKMVGKQFEQGFENLRARVEKQ